MNSHTKLATVWLIALFLLFVFEAPVSEALFFAYFLLYWAFPVAAGLILVHAMVRNRRKLRECVPPLLIVALGLSLFFGGGFRLGRLAYFQIRKDHYEKLLAEAIQTGEIPRGEGVLDEGPPKRYAFYWHRGVIDNWIGLVYDPTGTVAKINGSSDMIEFDHPELMDPGMLFGGMIYRCERLEGSWYLCWFT